MGQANSLTEVHGDWTVSCVATDGDASCAILQRQVRGGDRQLVLSIELVAADNGRSASGLLILPFGLRLDAGVLLAVDDAAPLPTLRFSTCLPAGCVVPLEFHEDTTPMMQQCGNMQVTAIANDSGQQVKLSIPLAGLGSAWRASPRSLARRGADTRISDDALQARTGRRRDDKNYRLALNGLLALESTGQLLPEESAWIPTVTGNLAHSMGIDGMVYLYDTGDAVGAEAMIREAIALDANQLWMQGPLAGSLLLQG